MTRSLTIDTTDWRTRLAEKDDTKGRSESQEVFFRARGLLEGMAFFEEDGVSPGEDGNGANDFSIFKAGGWKHVEFESVGFLLDPATG